MSGSSRSDTNLLVGDFCGRRRRFALAKKAESSSGSSGSAAIPISICCSSSDVEAFGDFSARSRKARLSDAVGIAFGLPSVGLSHADDPETVATRRPNQNMQARADETEGDKAGFAIVLPVIFSRQSRIPFEIHRRRKSSHAFRDWRSACLRPIHTSANCSYSATGPHQIVATFWNEVSRRAKAHVQATVARTRRARHNRRLSRMRGTA